MIKNFFYKLIILSKFKTLEIQFYFCDMYFSGLSSSIKILTDNSYFRFYLDLYVLKFDIDFSRKCDHQGIQLSFSILNVNFDINKYDIRHWDDEKDDYATSL